MKWCLYPKLFKTPYLLRERKRNKSYLLTTP